MSESLLSRFNLVSKLLRNKRFRDRYVYEHVRNGIPFQIRALRNEREWTQAGLGKVSGKARPVISRLEDPNYGKLSLKTLFEIASAFEVALLIKFVPFSRLVKEYEDVSWQALSAKSITDAEEIAKLEAWASSPSLAPTTAAYVLNAETGKFQVSGTNVREHTSPLTIELPSRKDNIPSPFIRGGNTDSTVILSGQETKAKAA